MTALFRANDVTPRQPAAAFTVPARRSKITARRLVGMVTGRPVSMSSAPVAWVVLPVSMSVKA